MAVAFTKKQFFALFLVVLFTLVLYLCSAYNYLLFHSLAELFAIVIICGMFIIAWNTRHLMTNHYFLFIGIAYLYVGLLDTLHLIAYQGMGILATGGANEATQFWIAARYVESLSLLISPLAIKRRINTWVAMGAYSAVTVILGLSILYWHNFPACFSSETGLTPFKKISEYIVVVLLICATVRLYRLRDSKDRLVLRWLLASIVATIVSEIAFTEYARVYDITNFVGHCFKIVSFYCLYKAVIESGLTRPYATLFKELKQSEQALRQAGEKLEDKVRERTLELRDTIKQLSEEMSRRMKAENMFRNLSHKCIDALESERKSAAREVHDSIGASLAAVKHMLEGVMTQLDRSNGAYFQQIKKTVFYLADTIHETRRISAKLRPLSLEELGLLPTIESYVRNFSDLYGTIQVDLTMEASEAQIPDPLKIVIYRILQEALSNVAQHSKASRVSIQLKIDQGRINFEMRDDGKGFDANITEHTHIEENSFGIQNMFERTELMGGHFSLMSSPAAGTCITIDFPLNF